MLSSTLSNPSLIMRLCGGWSLASKIENSQNRPTMPDQPNEKFPRSVELPIQSPLFWVGQKDRYLRQLLIRDIEELTNRRLVVYFANRFEAGSQIDGRDPAFMNELLGDINGQPTDLLLQTAGGVTDATEALVSIVQTLVRDLRVVVPYLAKSNGTLLCLAAKSIVMGPVSELGPIEPSINDIPTTILEQDEIAKNNFPLHMIGKYALQQTKSLAKRLLADGMMKGRPDAEIDGVVQTLASRDKYHSHGSVINHVEAKSMGLAVEYLTNGDPIWDRLWLLNCMYEHDCRNSRYLKIFEGRSRSTAVAASANR
jgi:Serine dehydrogenase proteinase